MSQLSIVNLPEVIEVCEPVRFQAVYRYKDMSIHVNRNDIANIAAALCQATRDEAERHGIVMLARALGVEVVR